jgi:hypothetical protein
VVENKWATAFMTLVTFWALLGDDIRLAFTDKSTDNTFFFLVLVCMGLFAIEIVVHSLAQPKYFNSFFFWLDFVSTCSLIMDIGWFWDNVVGTTETFDDTAEQAS